VQRLSRATVVHGAGRAHAGAGRQGKRVGLAMETATPARFWYSLPSALEEPARGRFRPEAHHQRRSARRTPVLTSVPAGTGARPTPVWWPADEHLGAGLCPGSWRGLYTMYFTSKRACPTGQRVTRGADRPAGSTGQPPTSLHKRPNAVSTRKICCSSGRSEHRPTPKVRGPRS
jgi:hypothetical protein